MEVLDIHSYIFRNAKETLKVISGLFQGYGVQKGKVLHTSSLLLIFFITKYVQSPTKEAGKLNVI